MTEPQEKRKAISKSTRFNVFKRDGFVCQYCGAHPPMVVLHVDHIHPVSEGGGNNANNLITACESCNLGKGARLLSDVPQALKDRAEEIKEREDQIKGYNAAIQARADRIEREAWEVAAVLTGEPEIPSYSRQNLLSIKRFLEHLPVSEVIEAAEIAASKRSCSSAYGFRYFCGICWKKIRETA